MHEKRNVVGYEAFEEWEETLARIHARRLAGNYGFTPDDVPDIEEELLLEIWIKRKRFNPQHRSQASLKTFMKKVLSNKVKNMIEHQMAQSRGMEATHFDFDEPLEQKDGTFLTPEEMLAKKEVLYPSISRPFWDTAVMRSAIRKVAAKLDIEEKRLCELLGSGHSLSDAQRILGKSRKAIRIKKTRIQDLFEEENLRDYI